MHHFFRAFLVAVALVSFVTVAQAQESPEPLLTADLEVLDPSSASVAAESTESAQASESSKLASPSAEVVQKIKEKAEEDITQPTETQKSKLAAYLDENPPGPLSWHNALQHAIRKAVENGLPANIVVLILLFPIITMIIAASRHVVGLEGFGIYIPAVLSVAFVSTGLTSGVVLFVAVLVAGIISRRAVRRLKMPYLPRTAMLLWGVSILVLGLLVAAALLNMVTLLTINIFPLLIMMLLTENFMETQLFSSQKKALRLTFETLMLAVGCAVLISLESVQRFVIVHPEITLISVAIANWALGRFNGLRLLEYLRFRSLLER